MQQHLKSLLGQLPIRPVRPEPHIISLANRPRQRRRNPASPLHRSRPGNRCPSRRPPQRHHKTLPRSRSREGECDRRSIQRQQKNRRRSNIHSIGCRTIARCHRLAIPLHQRNQQIIRNHLAIHKFQILRHQASVTGSWGLNEIVVAESAAPISCTTFPVVAGAEAIPTTPPGVVEITYRPAVNPVNCVFNPDK